LVLSACAGTSLFSDLDQANPTGSPFAQALFKNYAILARSFGEEGESSAATFDSSGGASDDNTAINDVGGLANAFAQKALDASKGEEVLPEAAPEGNDAADSGRVRLLQSLDQGRTKFPADAALAQAQYDCWVLNSQVDSQKGAAAKCKAGFDAAISRLEQEISPTATTVTTTTTTTTTLSAASYQVYFDWNGWNLTAENLSVLQQAINNARSGGQSHITVVGHTDTSGSAEYNQQLSVRRANVVEEALIDMGARREAIQVSGVGESDLAVQTADGVKEAKNRRSVITLIP
jgi:outer membrane protein OmpA-like peptidoglycan-associated protein